MAGYSDWNMSNNAVEALRNDKLTKSQLKAWQKRAVDAEAVQYCEAHHVGSDYKMVKFYKLSDFDNLNPADFTVAKVKQIKIEAAQKIKDAREKAEAEDRRNAVIYADFVKNFPEKTNSNNYYRAGEKPTTDEIQIGLERRRFSNEFLGEYSINATRYTYGIQERYNGNSWEIQEKTLLITHK
jgi:hypothetical protein